MFFRELIPMVTLVLLGITNASPMDVSARSPALLRRDNTVINCGGDLPTKDPANNLNTEADLHYFLPADLDLVRRLFGVVAENNDPTNTPYEFIVDCKPVSQCTNSVYAVTNHRPESGGPRTMIICPAFFTAPWASNDGLLPPDPENKDQQVRWCESDDPDSITMSYRKLVTPGHVLLHEITHLDKVGAFLENPVDSDGGHGTFYCSELDDEDPSIDDPGTDVLWQARQLQILWVKNGARDDTKDNTDQVVPPIRNAESFQGAELWCPTEAYFMMFCDKSWIAPGTGVGPDDEDDDPEEDPEWQPPS